MARNTIAIAALLLTVLLPGMAGAGQTTTAKITEGQWGVADKCNRTAIAKYPDHTAEALAKRDRDVRRCLLANRLPSRAPLAPPQTSRN
jgi:hypothetical protein